MIMSPGYWRHLNGFEAVMGNIHPISLLLPDFAMEPIQRRDTWWRLSRHDPKKDLSQRPSSSDRGTPVYPGIGMPSLLSCSCKAVVLVCSFVFILFASRYPDV